MVSYDLATTWWPIPTIILAVLVLLVKASQDNWKSLNEWASSVGISLAIFLAGLVFLYAPYAHNAKLKNEIAQNEAIRPQQPMIKDDGSQAIISDLQQQIIKKDIEAQELKRLRDRADDAEKRATSGITAMRRTLEDKERVISDLQGKADDKIARNDLKGKLLVYLHTTQIIKQNCLSGLKDYSPIKEFERWHDQTLRELRDLCLRNVTKLLRQ